jgi:hypothetical protein
MRHSREMVNARFPKPIMVAKACMNTARCSLAATSHQAKIYADKNPPSLGEFSTN